MTVVPMLAGRNPLKRALTLWIIVAVVLAVRTLVEPVHHTIFPVLAGSSAHWWTDQSLYADYAPLDFFRYPPTFAVVFTPLTALGSRLGGIVWSWLSIGVFVLGLWRFLRDVAPSSWTPGREAAFLALGALGALRGLWNAQSNALAVGLLLLAAAALVRRRWRAAAAMLAGSVLLKLTPLAPALLLCMIQPRRLPARFLLFLGLGLALPFLTRPPDMVANHYREWFYHLATTGSERWPGFRDAWTVWLVLREMLQGRFVAPPLREPVQSWIYRAVQLGTAAAALAWCLWQRRRCDDPRRLTTLVLAMGLAWLMLFGPAVEFPSYVFLTPVLIWALLEYRGSCRHLVVAAFVLVMLLGWAPAVTPALLTVLPMGTTLFMCWLIAYGQTNPTPSRKAGKEMAERPRLQYAA
ncbi:MAG TPA: glycosyltransferase family 87 protein [Gemmataceae bacterium]|nr:glycosyltransferase family 87 protein [Gemmataceae bacterium]